MHVEITKMVYQHPWYVFSAPLFSNGRLGVVFISPAEKIAVGVEFPWNCYWPDAESSWPDTSSHPDRWASNILIGRWLESSRLPTDASGRRFAALEPYCTRSDAVVLCPVGCRQRPVQCPVACLPSPLPSVQSPQWARFFVILHMAWFQSLCLDFAWYLGSSLVLLRSFLRCWSSDHHVAFVQVTSCTLLNYKINTCKFISPIWLCWSSNTKIQSKWAKGPFSLQTWWSIDI